MARKTHEQLMKAALARPRVKQEYEALEEEFALLKVLIKARLEAGKTQEQIAKEMGTTTSVVGRLETGGGKQKHSPTVATLQKYAHAVGCALQLKLVRCSKKETTKTKAHHS
jgi:transcriptional regulator with XRE-family HTH domain